MDVIRRIVVLLMLMAAPVWAEAGAVVNINTADAKVLAETMRGVGPAKAERIVLYREHNGPFNSIRELTRVQGIGKKTVEMNSDRITVSIGDNNGTPSGNK